jgi:2,3-bisphosphoglycerate-dependent phosphoglycerate mutase
MSRLFFMRHGESKGNIQAKLTPENPVGETANHEYELSVEGLKQVIKSGQWLRQSYRMDLLSCSIFTSTFVRTQQSCELALPNREFTDDSRLDEHWRGIWHTMPKQEVLDKYPEEDAIYKRNGWYHYRAPGGQSCPDVEAMIHSFLLDLQLNHAGRNIFLFGHGNWQVLFRRIIEHKTVAEAKVMQFNEFPPNASISVWDLPSANPKEAKLKLLNFVP